MVSIDIFVQSIDIDSTPILKCRCCNDGQGLSKDRTNKEGSILHKDRNDVANSGFANNVSQHKEAIMNSERGGAIVTGGASGIGEATVRRLASEGFDVLCADKNATALNSLKESWPLDKGRIVVAELDVTSPVQVDHIVDIAAREFGSINALVTCAGIGNQEQFVNTSIDDWNNIIAVNLTGTFLISQSVARVMIKQKFGSIVTIASAAGIFGVSGRSAYGASKGGVVLLTKVMAAELALLGVRANCIAPGPVDTNLAKQVQTNETRKAYYDAIPMGRYGTVEELAGAVSFLVGPDASFITGHILSVDGGMVSSGPLFKV
ncbi:SDR family oxidoreductase [Bradyrhizobium diazoefficiens]|nr:SDR family NAD(P)-dependent oxidoreductase [Bradyrhizobium diazoefficiens]MBR0967357.1 SDR family oxidoreductase [Bradyrhizobium diazoefficiens]MBR1049137.1 SDR family oxidoreductase [Bradyrhizobium diazoefficiens]MBR1106907.1 SDR family oxidoreductase [Bradyrhizobium diazoefficiens]MBR1113424.1 SDR family oxidoreductase [Bradyrhizobium diazoefficiens]